MSAAARHPDNTGIYKDFRISEVLRYPDSILVRTRMIGADYTLPAGGPGSHTFHAVLIPATKLRVKFESRDQVEQQGRAVISLGSNNPLRNRGDLSRRLVSAKARAVAGSAES